MARKIILEKSTIEDLLNFVRENAYEFISDGKFIITKQVKSDDKKASLLIQPNAYCKMKLLVDHFSTEVAWHGLVERKSENEWVLTDILVYPHEVGSATVTAEYGEYSEWLNTLDDETFSALKLHGHSHVNMATNPSTVDMEFRRNVVHQKLRSKKADSYYIFIILNKRGEVSGEIYDITNNTLYSTNDKSMIIKTVLTGGVYAEDFISDAKKIAKEKPKIQPKSHQSYAYSDKDKKGNATRSNKKILCEYCNEVVGKTCPEYENCYNDDDYIYPLDRYYEV